MLALSLLGMIHTECTNPGSHKWKTQLLSILDSIFLTPGHTRNISKPEMETV